MQAVSVSNVHFSGAVGFDEAKLERFGGNKGRADYYMFVTRKVL